MLLGIGVTLVLYVICAWLLRDDSDSAPVLQGAAIVILTGIGLWTLQLTLTDLNAAIEAAREAGESLPIWTQMILISAGIGLLALAWVLWRSAPKREHSGVFIVQMGAAAALLSAGYILVAQLPIVLANADDDLLRGFNVTVMYTIGTVPIQLFFGLLLAYLLFQKIRLKSMFRVLYFLPYVTPFIATSIVFGILFSHRPTSPVNQVLTALGMPVQRWLLEPTGLFQLVFGPGVPDILSGPSLALCVIIIYTAWTYIGYATVVFLAGLGNVQPDLYEAARIDGAGEWNLFRRITLPLLSPTTFFLTLITVIGTLQSFTQIYILRTPAAASTVDTVGVLIYETIGATEPNMGYGSALSLVLFTVILIFTFVQNRVARNRVFYG
jgi:multiple sugar transport system permease protein